ncbi:Protein maternal effect lethal 26-like protein, partial [Leptotrombidium deliense]
CRIEIFGKLKSTLTLSPSSPSKLYTKEEMEANSVSHDLKKLQSKVCFIPLLPESDKNTDLISIQIGDEAADDSSIILAHKLILVSRSNVFDAMLNGQFTSKEQAESKIVITDFDHSVIQEMVNFMYCDAVDESKLALIASALLMAADKYEVLRLKKICEQHLANSITLENGTEILKLGELCNCSNLVNKVKEHILQNSTKIENTNLAQLKRAFRYKQMTNSLIKKQRLE